MTNSEKSVAANIDNTNRHCALSQANAASGHLNTKELIERAEAYLKFLNGVDPDPENN